MWPLIMNAVRIYAPYIVWPAAAVVGVIGYNIEQAVRGDKQTPWRQSVLDEREQRHLLETSEGKDPTQVDKLKDRTFVPKTIFERNK